ncbi:hypothetical protein LTR12_016704 [Friedmanniomyces endolithicus]|nr:hypothetical protein LTR12_016704 [Friedmanniomyces endolithicus]
MATMPGGCAEVDARQSRKRGIASTPGGGAASSPTKGRRLNISAAQSDGIHKLAKITELAGTDFPPTAESEGTDCGRFWY